MSLSNHNILLLQHSNICIAWFHLWSFSPPRPAKTPLPIMLPTPWPISSVPLSVAQTQQTSIPAQSSYMPSLLLKPGNWMLLSPPINPRSPTSVEPCLLPRDHRHFLMFTLPLPSFNWMSNLLVLPLNSSHLTLSREPYPLFHREDGSHQTSTCS